ncbi:hypothetical protein J0X19_20875 [Hymenobacter sp. BT186]|uniref:Uncharacterized protein n=1 Tax=Hymenobacter telluris TaxID=2816474 RepID=A0A939F2Z6_9BACT|nr:hypothetical protein [Hymenobacter telluris]MBO0360428.1 hypothetical protein [Hymenobacter telluris]MBW3376455.1 hypothetical protein [Hymenobacter norwichensis]
MSTKKIALYTALLALLAAGLIVAYRGVQLYHEVTRPLVPVVAPAPAAPFANPGKRVITYSFSVVQEVVVPPAPATTTHQASRRRK